MRKSVRTFACKQCRRVYAYESRNDVDAKCPDCDNGPFGRWCVEV